MSEIIEHPHSGHVRRAGKQSTYKLNFTLHGYASTSAAIVALIAAPVSKVPASVVVDGHSLTERNYDVKARGRGNHIFDGVVDYTHIESPQNTQNNPVIEDVLDIESSIDFTMTQKFTRRAKTSTHKGTNAPASGTAIGWNPKGLAKGTFVDVPMSNLTYTKLEEASTVDDAWIVAREDLLGQVNNATFKGRVAETCRFVRMQLRQRSKGGPIHTTFTFQRGRKYTLDLATLNIGETGNMDIFPFRGYEEQYEEEKTTGGTRVYMTQKLIGFVEHQFEEIQPADFSLFAV